MKRMHTDSYRSRNGLTLIEVLVAVAILGVISAAVVSSFGGLVALNREAQVDNDLVAAARAEIEELRIWASPAAVFDDLTMEEVNAQLGGDAVCSTASDPAVFAPGVLRVDVVCDSDGASSLAEFSFLVVRQGP